MTREELPSFLRAFDPAQPPDPRQLLEGFLASRMVYYPGSGSDGQPIRVSNQERVAHCHLYADYGVPLDRLLRSIQQRGAGFRGYQILHEADAGFLLPPEDWWSGRRGKDSIMQMRRDRPSFARLFMFQRLPQFGGSHGAERFCLLFLCMCGVHAYDWLFCTRRIAPYLLVLQDHGFGGNWNTFGGGGLMEEFARGSGSLPKHLLVAENTRPWQGYREAPRDPLLPFKHGHARHFYTRVPGPGG